MTDSTTYFRVRNLDKYQHYKDRSPPWIKLHQATLDDYHFAQLPDTAKAHLMCIWLIAARADNKLPFDPDWIAHAIHAKSTVDLDILLAGRFIEAINVRARRKRPASKSLAGCKQVARPERETEEEREESTPPSDPPKGGSRRTSTGSRLPPDWTPSEADRFEAEKQSMSAGIMDYDIDDVAARFRDYWIGVAGAKGRKADWAATWRNWIRRDIDDKCSKPGGPSPPPEVDADGKTSFERLMAEKWADKKAKEEADALR